MKWIFFLMFLTGFSLAGCEEQPAEPGPVKNSPSIPVPAIETPTQNSPKSEMDTPQTTSPGFDPNVYGTSLTDIPYCSPSEGYNLNLDVEYPASGEPPFPTVVYVHGGSWVSGDKREGHQIPDRTQLVEGGNLFVSINYRLAPAHRFPAQIEDVKCAVRFLRENAGRLHLDTDRIAAMGSSAGGHLVALLGTADETAGWDAGREYAQQSSRVSAVVDLFGPAVPEGELSAQDRDLLREVFGATSLEDDVLKAASPVSYISPDDPPYLLIHGTLDTTVPLFQSERFAERLKDGGVPVELIVVQNAGHGLPDPGADTRPSFDEVMEQVRNFLEDAIGRSG